jgi:hypothetical protein
MNKKDIQKSVWDRAFDDLDEEGNKIEQSSKIKSDQKVNIARANRIRSQNPEMEEKRKIALAKIVATPEYRKKLGGKPSWNAGVPMDEKLKKQISNKLKGKTFPNRKGVPLTKEHREKISKANTGFVHSEESKKLLSIKVSKQLLIDGQPFYSRNEAAAFFGVDPGMINYWMNVSKKKDVKYISEEEYILLTGKDI